MLRLLVYVSNVLFQNLIKFHSGHTGQRRLCFTLAWVQCIFKNEHIFKQIYKKKGGK
jgi:hypothetical protein